MEKAKKNNARQTIVIVSFINPLPASQGNRRVICSLISWLRNNGFYVIFVLQAMNIPREMRGELESMVDELYVVGDVITAGSGKDESIKNTFIGLLKSFFWNLAYSKKNIVLRIFPDALIQRLSSALTQQIKPRNPRDCWPETISEVQSISGKYDPIAVISEYIYMTPCFEKLPKSILKLTHTHDMLSRVAEEIGAYGVDTQDRECRPDEERKALLRGDVVIALQANEARMFKELVPEREVIIVPYSGKHIVSRPSKVVVPNRILMVAANHPMNRRGLGLFCSEVWPIVMEAISDAQLRIVGGVSDALPTGTPNAESMGIVDDVAVEYKNASVIINPVDLGTGLKIKTVEA
ncbi:glycosyltransferase, partial [bacterium]|nr:glycosyltransferase [bacterium]